MDVPAAIGGGSEEKTAFFSKGARPARQGCRDRTS
jgi:hypothetical protein